MKKRFKYIWSLFAVVWILTPSFVLAQDGGNPQVVYVGPFTQTSFSLRSLLGFNPDEVISNSIIVILMGVITVATMRTNQRLKSSRRELEKSNRRLQNALEELESKENQIIQQERLRALGEMAGGVAHDFNNALQPIVLAASVLNRRKAELSDDPKIHEYINVINMASREAAGTVKRLVRFFKPGKNRTREIVDVNGIIEEVVRLTSPKWREEARDRGVMIEVETELQDGCLICGYGDEFREMMVNLIFNAADAIVREGKIFVKTVLESTNVLLTVSDNGVGMSSKVSERCLEPFFTTKTGRGTGLGLSIVYGVVRRLKGGIYIDSKLDEGTTFTICIPLAHGDEKEELDKVERKRGRLRKKANDGDLKFLLAEDNAAIRSLLADELRQQGHEVVLAASGDQAWDIYKKNKFDVILTDQSMPGLSGKQLARLIREKTPKKTIIMLTGFDTAMKSAELEGLIDAVLSKPVSIEDVMDVVRNVV